MSANQSIPFPIGQAALKAALGLRVPDPAVTSMAGPGARRTVVENGRTIERYPLNYAPSENNLAANLRFALKYEPLDLGLLSAAFKVASAREIDRLTSWIQSEPTGSYARRAWFLYEWLTGQNLHVPDAGAVAYADALDPTYHVTADESTPSRRHKVNNNLLGVPGYCPFVRKTERIQQYQSAALDAEARKLVADCDPEVLARAVNYLYTKETKSTFQIEGETATGQRAERFVAALRTSKAFDPTRKASLLDLQNIIVDPRYAAKDYRDFQNFVGETVGGYREVIHFICPRPQDISDLMSRWCAMTHKLDNAKADPVATAALIAFGFVFLHPFEDGNGRIHRYLIHHILAQRSFSPPDILFPVSAAIVRDRKGYDVALETFSATIQPFIDWQWGPDRTIEVANETADLYRYFDATALVEYLYEKVAETIRVDLKNELGFVAVYDASISAVREIVDVPDRRLSLLVRACLQNGGALSKAKRPKFAELTDAEIEAIQAAIQRAIAENAPVPSPEED
jgi:hypothetical protein